MALLSKDTPGRHGTTDNNFTTVSRGLVIHFSAFWRHVTCHFGLYFPELIQPDKDSLPVGLTFSEAVRMSSAGMDVLTHLPVSLTKSMDDPSATTIATTTIALPVSELIQANEQLKPNYQHLHHNNNNNNSKQGKGRWWCAYLSSRSFLFQFLIFLITSYLWSSAFLEKEGALWKRIILNVRKCSFREIGALFLKTPVVDELLSTCLIQ